MCKSRVGYALFSLLVAAVSLQAQVDGATSPAAVSDPSGAVIIGTSISINSEATGLHRQVESNSSRRLSAFGTAGSAPRIGRQQVRACDARYRELELSVGKVRKVDAELPVGATSNEVQVIAEVQPIEQTSAEIGVVIDAQQINSILLNGRNWSALLALAPGATNTGEGPQNTFHSMVADGTKTISPSTEWTRRG